jgi:PAS domain S-box-containing protein
MVNRRKRQQRGILLSFVGILVGLLLTLGFRLLGYWTFEISLLGTWLLVAAGVHAGLWLLLEVGWRRYERWDPHFLYLPWACIVLLFTLLIHSVPEVRYLVPFGYFVNLLFLVGLAGFWEVLIFSGLMAGGYFGAILLVLRRGEEISFGYESMMAVLILVLGAYAGTVLERARRHRTSLRRASDQLRKLSVAVDQSPSLLIITDTEGRIEYVNPRFVQTTGYSLEEARGKTPAILRSEDTPEKTYEELWQTILDGEVWKGELKNLKKDGAPYWVIASISPLRDSSGSITHFLGVQEDITRRKEVEAQLVQAQKMESVGQLVSGVAHDFNNLLTGVLGFTELALSKVADGDPLHQDLDEIRKAGETASALTQQLLAFGRQQMLWPEVLNLNQVLTTTEELLRRTITEDIELETALEPDLGLVSADPAQIQQILVNLIETENAELGERFANKHVAVRPGRYVMLAVSDTGPGMTEEIRARVFEPFFTTKERGRGTGLGLATVYGIVKQSRGYIWVYSEPGQGTTFKVFLPRIEEVVPEVSEAVVVDERLAGAETILLVEDDNVVRSLAEAILVGAGYRVLAAEDSARAKERWQEAVVDLLITDIVMPGINGVELAEQLTALRPDLKVLLVSGHAERTIIEDRLADPTIPFIGKPFKVTEFLAKVRQVLDT